MQPYIGFVNPRSSPGIATPGAPASAGSGLIPSARRPGSYYGPLGAVSGFVSQGSPVDSLHAAPFWSGAHGAYDRIAVEVAAAGAGNVRLGVYDSDLRNPAQPFPRNRLVDSGVLSTAGAIAQAVIALTLEPYTLYWLAIVSDSGAWSWRAFVSQPFFGYDPNAQAFQHVLTVAFPFAALPARFPETATVPGALGHTSVPGIQLRAA